MTQWEARESSLLELHGSKLKCPGERRGGLVSALGSQYLYDSQRVCSRGKKKKKITESLHINSVINWIRGYDRECLCVYVLGAIIWLTFHHLLLAFRVSEKFYTITKLPSILFHVFEHEVLWWISLWPSANDFCNALEFPLCFGSLLYSQKQISRCFIIGTRGLCGFCNLETVVTPACYIFCTINTLCILSVSCVFLQQFSDPYVITSYLFCSSLSGCTSTYGCTTPTD